MSIEDSSPLAQKMYYRSLDLLKGRFEACAAITKSSWRFPDIFKTAYRALLLVICFSLVAAPSASTVLADRGMVPISDVSIYGPGQKAIIAWDGEEEILILSTDVRASGNSQVLEILPLPSKPEVEKGDFASFEQVDKLIKEHFPSHDQFRKSLQAPGEGVEILFHEKIGAHDITVVKAADSAELVKWAEEFLKDAGIEYRISSPSLELVAGEYMARGINFFVFDLIEVSPSPKSIEPIKYRFDSEFLYYPLKISTLAKGWTDINLFLLTPQKLEPSWLVERSELPQGMEVARFYDRKGTQPVQFKITREKLASIDKDIASLLENDSWLTAMTYHGDLAHLDRDLRVYKAPDKAELLFNYYPGTCTPRRKAEATIATLGDVIVVYGVALTPTPCYELEARLDIPHTFAYPTTVIINITHREKPGICVECLGEVTFRAKIAGMDPAQAYDIIVEYNGEAISQQRVYLPLSNPIRSDYPQLPDETILETVGTPMTGFTFQADGEALAPEIVVRINVKGNDDRTYIAYLKLDKGRSNAIVEVNNIPATVKLSENCRIKIVDRQIFLDDGYWLIPVRVMPGDAVADTRLELSHVELEAIDGKAMYEVQGVIRGRILGLVPKEVNIEVQIDAFTGEVVTEKRPWWAIFCW